MQDTIRVQGARVNNLKNITVEIPRDKLVVLTGLSGSGKSSLAFDTIYAEGQRRYVESLSSYARMFLGQMDKPDVDAIDHFHRSEDDQQEPPFHGRHRDGNLRLSAPFMGALRCAALSEVRQRDPAADCRPDRRSNHAPSRKDALSDTLPCCARKQG